MNFLPVQLNYMLCLCKPAHNYATRLCYKAEVGSVAVVAF